MTNALKKEEIRAELINRRKRFSEKKDAFDEAIFNKIISDKGFIKSKTVLTYVSTEIEVDTLRIIEYCFNNSKTVAVPRCVDNSNKMVFYIIDSLKDLEKGSFNLLEPKPYCSEINSFEDAVCIVPGLAFDYSGNRIGYGKGFYDRFLTENNIYSIGICYSCFIEEKLPVDFYDKPVNRVIAD